MFSQLHESILINGKQVSSFPEVIRKKNQKPHSTGVVKVKGGKHGNLWGRHEMTTSQLHTQTHTHKTLITIFIAALFTITKNQRGGRGRGITRCPSMVNDYTVIHS